MALRNSADHEEFIRQIKSFMKIEGLEFDPERPNELFVDNLFRPTFSFLVAWDGHKYRRVEVASSGRLEVRMATDGYDDYSVHEFSGISSDTVHDFGSVYDRIYVDLTAGNMLLEVDTGNGTFGDEIHIHTESDLWVPLSCERVRYDDDGTNVSGRITVFR
jgi:hypothetical protein